MRSVEEDKESQVEARSLEEQRRQQARDCRAAKGSSQHQAEVRHNQRPLEELAGLEEHRKAVLVAVVSRPSAAVSFEEEYRPVEEVARTLVDPELDRGAVGTDRAVEARIGLEEVLAGQVVEVHIVLGL